MQELVYGERDGARTERVEALDAVLGGAGFEARLSRAIMQEIWEKWVMLAAMGAATCLLRGKVGEIEGVPGGSALALRFLEEAALVAAASGYPAREASAARTRAILTAKGSTLASSMYRDLEANLPVEVEHILGDLLRRAGDLGLTTPLLEAATAQLRIYQNRILAARNG
jgi:2-dehydropantoate 2-reductase